MKINKMMLVKVLILVSTFINAEVSVGQSTANRIDDIQAALPQIDKIFRNFADSNHLPGLIYGLVVDGKLVHTFNTGYTDLEKKILVSPQSCFRIASMSKSFTALAILQLRDEGMLKLDDPAYLYIPELKNQVYPGLDAPVITIRNLLTHTAGFPEDNPWGDRQLAISDEALVNMIKKGISFSNDPGTNFEYSNMGYALLGYIIKKVSAQPYQKYITNNILIPLGMTHTYWDYRDVPEVQLANGYRWLNGEWKKELLLKDGAYGAMGGLISSMDDFSKYLSFQLAAWHNANEPDKGPVKRSSLREMQRSCNMAFFVPQYKYLSGRPCPINVGYGYGMVDILDCDQKKLKGHSGGLPGFGSDWLMAPDYGIGIIAFSNLTYAKVYRLNLSVLDTLLILAKLQPKRLQASAILNQRKNELMKLLPNGNNAAATGIFAENFFMDYFPDSLRKEAKAIFDSAGKIQKVNEMTAENNLRGSFILVAERSNIKIHITLTPENPPLIQEYGIEEIKKD